MKISVTGRQMDVGEAIQQHIQTIAQDLCAKYHLEPLDTQVVMSKDTHHNHHRFKTEVSMKLGRGVEVRAHGEADQAHEGVDGAFEMLGTRVRRYKKKLKDHLKHRDAHVEKSMALQYVLNGGSHDEEVEDEHPLIIAETTTEIPTLSVSEAVMRMDLSDQTAFIFKNTTHGGINVVYKRCDGHIGWIDPKLKN